MFDVKLRDGRYFSNVDIVDEIVGDLELIETILDNANYYMFIYHVNDDNCEDLLAQIKSDDIEYICKSYKYEGRI